MFAQLWSLSMTTGERCPVCSGFEVTAGEQQVVATDAETGESVAMFVPAFLCETCGASWLDEVELAPAIEQDQ